MNSLIRTRHPAFTSSSVRRFGDIKNRKPPAEEVKRKQLAKKLKKKRRKGGKHV